VVAVVAAGCGSLSLSSKSPAVDQTVLSSERSPYGQILATGAGYTLYDFAIDTPTASRCPNGACTVSWPPLIVQGRVVAENGVRESLVGEVTRPGGARQVTYGGHPLYTYREDSAPHQTSGQALLQFGAPWYVVSVSGQPVTTSSS
jgi:predicted lipoprotein with Yx(FWY)xxD motif